MIKAYKEEVFCAVVSEMITAQVLFISECKGCMRQLRVASEYN